MEVCKRSSIKEIEANVFTPSWWLTFEISDQPNERWWSYYFILFLFFFLYFFYWVCPSHRISSYNPYRGKQGDKYYWSSAYMVYIFHWKTHPMRIYFTGVYTFILSRLSVLDPAAKPSLLPHSPPWPKQPNKNRST